MMSDDARVTTIPPPRVLASFSSDDEAPERLFRIGIVIKNRPIYPTRLSLGSLATAYSAEKVVRAVYSPLSRCQITHLVLLSSNPVDPSKENDDAILLQYHVLPGSARVLRGEAGFQQILQTDDIDALYIFVPNECQKQEYVKAALEARKHVLLDDPESTSFDEFKEQLVSARKARRFVQFPTMFVHQHRVESFLSCVLFENFGIIESINVRLLVHYNDLDKVGITLPLNKGQGCIQRLGRFCVLISTLMLMRADGSRPLSAQVLKFTKSGTGEPLSAECMVKFSGDRTLTFQVAYSLAQTRQVLEVRSHDRIATMTDFVIPHPDGLSTYRVYDRAPSTETGELEVVRGEALDVPKGPSQDVMMWRRFRDLCLAIEEEGWVDSPKTRGASEVTSVALQTKRCLNALQESAENECVEVPIALEGEL